MEPMIAKKAHTEPEYFELLKMEPGPELDKLTAETIFPDLKFPLHFPKYSQDIAEAFKVVKKMGYITLSTDEGIHSVSCRFLEGRGFGREVHGYITIPEAICKAAIAVKKFPLEPFSRDSNDQRASK